jgi:hypothetical protein
VFKPVQAEISAKQDKTTKTALMLTHHSRLTLGLRAQSEICRIARGAIGLVVAFGGARYALGVLGVGRPDRPGLAVATTT